MGIFSKKTEIDQSPKQTEAVGGAVIAKAVVAPQSKLVLVPRLSEKMYAMGPLNKYIFTVDIKANKVEIRKAVEKQFGVRVVGVNIIRSQGKTRRYGRTLGRMSDFKKAIVTLSKDSKKIDIAEAA